MKYHSSSPTFPFLPRRAICDSALTGVLAQAVSRPPSSATTAGVWSGTGTKAAAILSPPPPVSLFPQSLSLFPSLRQLSRTCTTQREPCVALPIAALPARPPRPSSNKLSGPLLDRLQRALHCDSCCSLLVRLFRSLLLFAACALLSHPSHPPGPPSPR